MSKNFVHSKENSHSAEKKLVSRFYEDFQKRREKKGTLAIPERLEFIKSETGKGNTVAELGCRFGDILQEIKDGNDIVGVDVDRNAMQICGKKLGIIPIFADLNESLPFENESFDVVIISEVLEHLPYPTATLGEIARILRKGGKIVGSVPNGQKLRNKIRFFLEGIVDTDESHLQFFSGSSIKLLLEKNFSAVKIKHVSGRLIRLRPSMFGNYILFSAVKT